MALVDLPDCVESHATRTTMPITTVQELRDHLALAAKIELSLVPPYLYAMYSKESPLLTRDTVFGRGRSQWARV